MVYGCFYQVIGPHRSGKSFLLNQLLSLSCYEGASFIATRIYTQHAFQGFLSVFVVVYQYLIVLDNLR